MEEFLQEIEGKEDIMATREQMTLGWGGRSPGQEEES